MWRGGTRGEPELLASCYRRALELAREYDVRTIAFPAISCGVYGYPLDRAAAVAVGEVGAFLAREPSIEKVYFVCFSPPVEAAHQEALAAAE